MKLEKAAKLYYSNQRSKDWFTTNLKNRINTEKDKSKLKLIKRQLRILEGKRNLSDKIKFSLLFIKCLFGRGKHGKQTISS